MFAFIIDIFKYRGKLCKPISDLVWIYTDCQKKFLNFSADETKQTTSIVKGSIGQLYLRIRNPYTGTLANSEVPDEMPHNVSFDQGLHFLLRQNPYSEKEDQNFWK